MEKYKINEFSKYEIDKSGNVYSNHTKKKMFVTIDQSGYGWVRVYHDIDKRDKAIRVHKLMQYAFHYNSIGKKHVNHIDGNKLNNNIENLELCTNKENTIKGYSGRQYHSRSKIGVTAIDTSGTSRSFASLREMNDKIGISRKLVKSIMDGVKENNTGYKFFFNYKPSFDIIVDDTAVFETCRRVDLHYGFYEGATADLLRNKNSVIYKNLKIEKVYY